MTVTFVRNVAPPSLVEMYRRFRDAYCLHIKAMTDMAALRNFETAVSFYQTAHGAPLQKTVIFKVRGGFLQLRNFPSHADGVTTSPLVSDVRFYCCNHDGQLCH
jgi:hypothetical protein